FDGGSQLVVKVCTRRPDPEKIQGAATQDILISLNALVKSLKQSICARTSQGLAVAAFLKMTWFIRRTSKPDQGRRKPDLRPALKMGYQLQPGGGVRGPG